ncbi:major capsid protein, partial [Tsukamurella sputi]|uniref:major capsid protein n=1 Tax=Tsukamurella sputi TaxID=2591848 RepID=UPI0027B9F47A
RRTRNDVDYLDQQTTQLANTIAKKIDDEAMRVLMAALDDVVTEQPSIVGHSWGDLVTVGPLDQLTPSAHLPTADWSAAQLAADLQQLGVIHDVLVVHPSSAHALRTAYGDKLAAVLTSAGLELVSNIKVPVGGAYVAQKGEVGVVGYETALTVTSWPDYETRSTIVQAYAVPAFAVNKPFHVKHIAGVL